MSAALLRSDGPPGGRPSGSRARPSNAPTTRLLALGRAATVALYDELALDPKPGLVSFVDTGSHDDMDASTFLRSLFALRHYFPRIAAAGADGASFAELKALGMAAEQRMLQATAHINTHRGAVFTLGLICAAAGRALAVGDPMTPENIRNTLRMHWGSDLLDHARSAGASNGRQAARRHRLRPVAEEAALGFPVLFETALPALRAARGLGERRARLQALFQVIEVLDDTNLAHRGGLSGLRFAQQAAREFLCAGGAARPDAIDHARAIHDGFVSRRLSPGGAADVLAAACLLNRICLSP